MATWFDLPREIKQIIFQQVFDTPFIKYKPRDRRLKEDKGYESSLQFRALYRVSKAFATVDELNDALLQASTLVVRKPSQIRRMISEMPVSSTANIRQIKLVSVRTDSDRPNFPKDCMESLQINERTFGEHMPDLRKLVVTNQGRYPYDNDMMIGAITMFTRQEDPWTADPFPSADPNVTDATVLSQLMAYVLDPDQQKHERLVEDRSYTAFNSVAYRMMSRDLGTSKHKPKRRPWPWMSRLLKYAAAKGIEVVFEMSCMLDLQYMLPNSYHYLRTLRPYVGDATMSTNDWILRFKNNGQEYQFYQASARQLFPY